MYKNYFIKSEKITFTDKNYEPNVFPNTWFVQKPIDVEHKYWKLMAYLKRVDDNIKKGFLFQEFETLEKRYKDLESFSETYEIINKDKESEELFNYIYELPSISTELKEINNIVSNSIKLLKQKYLELSIAIKFLKDNFSIVRREIRDGRKKLHIYIEMCNCSIIEHYTVSKTGNIDYLGSFHSILPYIEDEKNNLLEVKTNIALNAKGTIIPFILKFML